MYRVLISLLLISFGSGFAQTPVGLWRNIDDETGKPKAEIEIFEENGVLYGRIVKLLNPSEPNPKCKKCPGEFKDKPIEGLRIMWGLKKTGNEYTGGKILDPNNGNIYSCKMELVEPNKLKVRGFLGVSLLGRTQYWYRIK
ncbi:MAG: DUF2147 domain-containing protein [Leptospiraceae bacterium]|nr:DUF2147 domain-containing protein [Leptospiraceae bacterium]MDW7976427.1 DUF2147 domain-containing protein [Leptospiraceae bacterium]